MPLSYHAIHTRRVCIAGALVTASYVSSENRRRRFIHACVGEDSVCAGMCSHGWETALSS